MTWQVFSRPEAANDVIEIADWYDSRDKGLGERFIEEFLAVLDALSRKPLIHSRRHPHKNIRWRLSKEFPLQSNLRSDRAEKMVVVAAVLHAARHDRQWKRRV